MLYCTGRECDYKFLELSFLSFFHFFLFQQLLLTLLSVGLSWPTEVKKANRDLLSRWILISNHINSKYRDIFLFVSEFHALKKEYSGCSLSICRGKKQSEISCFSVTIEHDKLTGVKASIY